MSIITALVVNCFDASAAISDYSDPYNQNSTDLNNVKSKPVLSVTKKVFNSSEEAKGKVVTITLNLSGKNVDGKYCNTSFHVYWDDRLTVIPQKNGKYAKIISGDNAALGELSCEAVENGLNGVFLFSTGNDDRGYTGDMWTIDLQVPENAENGDIYPIDICFKSVNKKDDIFTNINNDADGKMMQTYFFTKGINSKENPSDDPWLVKANTEFADGYIAISDIVETEQIEGDANCDGELSMADAVLIMQFIANPDKYGENGTNEYHITEQGKINADIAGANDGITNSDALEVQKKLLKLK
jgi:hypothetical protein